MASQKRDRLDLALVDRGLVDSRSRAQALIMSGAVNVDGVTVTKAGTPVPPSSQIEVSASANRFVSRGGLKLHHALSEFGADVSGMICIDVGASTGGFTDALLEAGAKRVYAVDVGYGQLAWSLRNDPRVVVMERTNIRNLDELPETANFAVVDVSFISLQLVLPAVSRLMKDGAALVLIKPQFEAGRAQVGKRGVIRDPKVWESVLCRILTFADQTGWSLRGLTMSPIRGPAGNVEFLAELVQGSDGGLNIDGEVARVLDLSGHKLL